MRRAEASRRAGVPLCESSSGSGNGRAVSREAGAAERSVTGSPYRTVRFRLPGVRSTVPRMDDLFEPYQRTRTRVSTLFLDATPAALARTVPACPAWSVHDLAAHLVGVPATLAAGNFPDGDVDAWLQGIVDDRRDARVDDLMDEWNTLDGAMAPMLQGMGALMFADVAIHEHDLRGALGSRRTADELRALPSDGGGEAYFAVIAGHLPLPEPSLGE